MKKRAFAWILLLMLLVTLLPAAVSAADADSGSTEAEPLLTARYYDWDEKKTAEYNRLSSADPDNSLRADSVQWVVFFYGDEMIPRSALVTTGKIDIAAAEDEQIPEAYQGYVCELRLGSFETGKIMYVNTDTHRTIAKLSVTGMLPTIGLFQTAEYSQNSYIWDGTDVKTLPDTVYLLGDEQTTITDVSVERGGELVTAKAPQEGEANVTLVQQPNLTLRGRSIPRVRLHADAGKFFCARLELTFTLDLTEFDLGTQSYTVGNGALYVCSGEAHFKVDKNMSATELNEVLSSTANLLDFLQKTDPEVYTLYRLSTANSFTGDYSIILDLPAVEYDKPIGLAADRAVRGGI